MIVAPIIVEGGTAEQPRASESDHNDEFGLGQAVVITGNFPGVQNEPVVRRREQKRSCWLERDEVDASHHQQIILSASKCILDGHFRHRQIRSFKSSDVFNKNW